MPAVLTRPFSPHPPGDGPHPAPLFIDVTCPDADTMVVTPVGEADLCTVPDLRQTLDEVTAGGRSHVIVDLDNLTFIDASTLGVLAEARARFSATGGTFQVRCRTDHGRRMLSITGLEDMLDHHA